MKKSRIWIDMTDLNVWSGHMTGIQRVVYLNAKRFAQSPDYDARFFVFDDVRTIFTEIQFEQVQNKIEQEQTAEQNGDPAGRSLKQLVKAAPRALVRRMPDSVKQRIPVEVKQGIKGGARLGLSLMRRTKHAVSRRLSTVKPAYVAPVTFDQDSIVLIMGKSWDFPDLITELGLLKQKQHFKLVHLVHDMIPIMQPHMFGPGLFEPYTRTMFEIMGLCDGVLAQSKATAQDVERFCRELLIPLPRIKTVRLGDELLDIDLPSDEPSPHSRIKKGDFILQVGTVEARKNHQLVYMAYRLAALQGKKLPPWVVVGSRGWLTGDVLWQMEHDPLVKDNIIVLGGVPDRAKLWLFRNCRFTVYPSIYEGWGMPVGESLAYGKVCITSNMSSLPEVGGKLADQVSPYDAQQLLDTMLHYMSDKNLRTREKQIAAYKPASWEDMFRDISNFVEEM